MNLHPRKSITVLPKDLINISSDYSFFTTMDLKIATKITLFYDKSSFFKSLATSFEQIRVFIIKKFHIMIIRIYSFCIDRKICVQ